MKAVNLSGDRFQSGEIAQGSFDLGAKKFVDKNKMARTAKRLDHGFGPASNGPRPMLTFGIDQGSVVDRRFRRDSPPTPIRPARHDNRKSPSHAQSSVSGWPRQSRSETAAASTGIGLGDCTAKRMRGPGPELGKVPGGRGIRRRDGDCDRIKA
jgi:hypothetical protein